MALRRGTTAVKKTMRGTTAVKKVYRGTVLVWAARYYATITGPDVSVTSNTSLSLAMSHTVTWAGLSIISGGGTWAAPTFTRQVQVRVNGTIVADASTTTDDVHPTATSAEQTLAAGDIVELWARHSSTSSSARVLSPALTFV